MGRANNCDKPYLPAVFVTFSDAYFRRDLGNTSNIRFFFYLDLFVIHIIANLKGIEIQKRMCDRWSRAPVFS